MNNNGNLFFALMYKDKEVLEKIIDLLKNNFGNIISKSPEYDFDFTYYYEKEFGINLKKTIIIFNMKINKKDLIKIKNKTSEIEKKFLKNNKRTINIDPGYVNNMEAVLASFKKKDFKETLGNNVYAHTVLKFDDKKFDDNKIITFWHTFPDFKGSLVQKFFLDFLGL